MPNTQDNKKAKEKKMTFDILMGVGADFYPDPSFFIEEVLRLGLNKRIPQAPGFFDPSKNALWLVHWGTRKIFGLVIGLRYRIFASEDSLECRRAKQLYGEDNVICKEFGEDPGDFVERGCGYIKGEGKYVRQRYKI